MVSLFFHFLSHRRKHLLRACESMASTQAMLIKRLRESSGAPMVDCKKAIMATADVGEAFEWLRRKGLSRAAKFAERVATEGLVAFRVNDERTLGCIVEVNSETDFVARNALFREFAETVASAAAKSGSPAASFDLSGMVLETKEGERTAAEAAASVSGMVGERVSIGRFASVEGDLVSGYAHGAQSPYLGTTASLVAVKAPKIDDALLQALNRTAMHVVAARPLFLRPDDIPQDLIDKETDIIKDQLKDQLSNKPENIIQKVIQGKLTKFANERALATQVSLVEEGPKRTIDAILQDDFHAHLNAFEYLKIGE